MASADLPPSLAANPVLGHWIRIRSDGIVEVRSGKVELGQGVLTALAQIAAEELDVNVTRVQMIAAATDLSPDEGFTAGSLSIQNSVAALRQVWAEARALSLAVAAATLAATTEELEVADGQIAGPGDSATSYWELAADSLLDRPATGDAPSKEQSGDQVVGTNVARLDLPDKLTGRPRYLHDLVLDGQVYGRIVRPPSRGARLRDVDTAPTKAVPGVITVVRDGDFLGVVAEREEIALRAAERLRGEASWDERPTLPDENDLPEFLVSAEADTSVLASSEKSTPTQATRSHSARYHRPYLAHGSIGPSAPSALAHGDGRLEVWSHSQGVHVLRRELATALDVAHDRVLVRHVDGAGCYGHNGADDAAMDAALLAQAVPGRPVQVVWSRADELTWAPFGAAAVVRVAAGVDAAGNALSWQHEIWGTGD